MIGSQTVCLIYGLGEGKQTSKALRQALESSGYVMVTNPHTANILIAHSGGCLLIPHDTQATKIVNVGYTYWPQRPLLVSHSLNFRQLLTQSSMTEALRMLALFVVYIWNVNLTVKLANAWQNRRKKLAEADDRYVFIRNQNDSFCKPQILIELASKSKLISMTGEHNDLWHRPERYVELLELV